MNNILITSAGRRVSLIKAFKKISMKLKLKSKVFITDLDIKDHQPRYLQMIRLK